MAGTPQGAVLVVDDEADVREAVCDVLADALGVQCKAAGSGAEALEILAKNGVALVLTDFKMPGMNGMQLLQRVTEVAPGVQCMMMTAFPDLDIAIDAINEARIQAFFTKPLEPAKIVAAVERILQQRDAEPRGLRR